MNKVQDKILELLAGYSMTRRGIAAMLCADGVCTDAYARGMLGSDLQRLTHAGRLVRESDGLVYRYTTAAKPRYRAYSAMHDWRVMDERVPGSPRQVAQCTGAEAETIAKALNDLDRKTVAVRNR